MTNILIIIAILLPLPVAAQGIRFHTGNWDDILQMAKEEDKLLEKINMAKFLAK